MQKAALLTVLILAGGLAVAFFLPREPEPAAGRVAASRAVAVGVRDNVPLESRLAELERSVAEERQARQLLQEELLYLTQEIESLRGETPRANTTAAAATAQADPANSRRERFARRNLPEFRAQRLIEAGLSPERAEYVLQREAALRMSMIEARFDARQNGETVDYGELRRDAATALRNELGVADYERYLEGTGRSTAVVVSSVIDTSPAQRVGLQPGDRIVRYDGTRVYNMSDLDRAMRAGQPGETITAEVVRDGVAMQLAVRRGPLGITSGRGGR